MKLTWMVLGSFKFLADGEAGVTKACGSVASHDGRNCAAPNTFSIDPAGVVRKLYLKLNSAKHGGQVLADLAALQATQ